MTVKVKIIAEIGSNYDDSFDKAAQMIATVKRCGADAVKFQTLRKDRLVAPQILLDGAWIDNPVYQGFSNLELPDVWHHRLHAVAVAEQIEFISTPFYLEAVELLENVGVSTYKIASGDITFKPLLEAVGKTGKSVILSTGASALEEVSEAYKILNRAGASDITLLHCVSNYPPVWEEMNLNTITTLKEAFGIPVGISDHTPGALIPIVSVSLGATVIEKHVTIEKTSIGPDHAYAMTMDEFADMVQQVRLTERVLGDGKKIPTAAELEKQNRIRRGVYDTTTFKPKDGQEGLWLRPIPNVKA